MVCPLLRLSVGRELREEVVHIRRQTQETLARTAALRANALRLRQPESIRPDTVAPQSTTNNKKSRGGAPRAPVCSNKGTARTKAPIRDKGGGPSRARRKKQPTSTLSMVDDGTEDDPPPFLPLHAVDPGSVAGLANDPSVIDELHELTPWLVPTTLNEAATDHARFVAERDALLEHTHPNKDELRVQFESLDLQMRIDSIEQAYPCLQPGNPSSSYSVRSEADDEGFLNSVFA